MVLTVTILFSAMLFISNVAAQEGDPQGDPDDADQLRNCTPEDEGLCLHLTQRLGALETPRDRAEAGDPMGDPLKTRSGDPIEAVL